MTYTREQVHAAIREVFGEAEIPVVMAMLDAYGVEPHEQERERVQLAIVRLSEGQRDKLSAYVQSAKQDYRDVLMWSESPPAAATTVIDALRLQWTWAMPAPVQVLARNPFGNVLVEGADGSVWRVCPENLEVSKVAESAAALDRLWADEEFATDWAVEPWVADAESRLGPLAAGQCYGFRIWPALNGDYSVENMVIKTMVEWLAASGDAGRQMNARRGTS